MSGKTAGTATLPRDLSSSSSRRLGASAGFEAVGTRGQPFSYQIIATNSPASFGVRGALPDGLIFDDTLGLIAGTPQEAGRFELDIAASNSGGSDRKVITLVSLPVLEDQELTVPARDPLSYQIQSSEAGPGVLFEATGNLLAPVLAHATVNALNLRFLSTRYARY